MLSEFLLFFEVFQDSQLTLLESKDEGGKSLLHRACEEGRFKFVKELVRLFKAHRLGLDEDDGNGSTPLELACVKGFNVVTDVREMDMPDVEGEKASYRYWIVKELLAAEGEAGEKLVHIRAGGGRREGNYGPLHWAIYWADLELANLLVTHNPMLLFIENYRDQIPFDICKMSLNKAFNYKAMLVVNQLLDLVYEVLENPKAKIEEIEDFFKNKEKLMLRTRDVQERLQSRLMISLSGMGFHLIVDQFYKGLNEESKKEFLRLMGIKLKENRALRKETYKSVKDMEIFTEKTILTRYSVNSMSYFVHRVITWFAYFERRSQLITLLRRYHISPFMPNNSGMSVVHILAEQGFSETLSLLLDIEYTYKNSSKEFRLERVIDIPTTDYLNTPLHIAAMKSRKQIFEEILVKRGLGDVYRLNQRCVSVLDLMPSKPSNEELDNSFWSLLKDKFEVMMDMQFLASQPLEKMDNNFERLISVDNNYDFALIVSGDVEDGKDSLVYRQLLKINEEIAEQNPNAKLEISEPIPGFTNYLDKTEVNQFKIIRDKKIIRKNYFIILLKPNHELYSYMSDTLNYKVFNTAKGFRQVYIHDSRNNDNYEPLKEYQKQTIIMNLLEEEFNIKKFHQKGFVLDFFPIHNFKERNKIKESFSKYFWDILVDPLVPGYHSQVLIPLTQVGLYHGLQNGYYFGFLSMLTAYMFPLGLTGLVFYLYGILVLGGIQNHLGAIFGMIISIWSTLFTEAYYKREKELSFSYDAMHFKEQPKIREEYRGRFIIDDVTKEIRKEDRWSPRNRRILVIL